MATQTAEPVDLAAPTGAPSRGIGVRHFIGIAAVAVSALVALAVHLFLPSQQVLPMSWMDKLPAWRNPYPVVLEALVIGAVVAVVAQTLRPALRSWVCHFGPLIAGATLAMTVWDLITSKLAWMPQPYFPGPNEVFGALFEDRDLLFDSTWHSLRLLLSGYLVGVAVGLVVGVFVGWFRSVRYWGMPILKVMGPIPATALVALAMMLPGNSFFSGVGLIAYAVSFPVTMLTASGIANVRLSYLDVARTLGAGRLFLIFRVAIPSALPNVFIGLFIGLTASFLTLIPAESVGVKDGLGWYLQLQKGNMVYANVYASLVVMAVFFSTLMTLLFKLRDAVLKWQKGVIRW